MIRTDVKLSELEVKKEQEEEWEISDSLKKIHCSGIKELYIVL